MGVGKDPRDNRQMADLAMEEERARKAIFMKIAGATWSEVAKEIGVAHPAGAYKVVEKYRQKNLSSINEGLEELRQQANERLDFLRGQAVKVMTTPHYLYEKGKPVLDTDDEGNQVKVIDDAPRLNAVNTFLKIEERWAKNNGTDHSEKVEVALERRMDMETTRVVEAILYAVDNAGVDAATRQRMLQAAQLKLGAIDGEVVSEGPEAIEG